MQFNTSNSHLDYSDNPPDNPICRECGEEIFISDGDAELYYEENHLWICGDCLRYLNE